MTEKLHSQLKYPAARGGDSLFGAIWRLNEYRHSTPVLLSRYPQLGGRVDELMAPDANDGSSWRGRVVVRVQVFEGNAKPAEVTWLWDTAFASQHQYESGFIRRTRDSRLTKSQFQSAQQSLSKLPSNNDLPPFDRLLILGFEQDGQWTTRIYNWEKQPAPIRLVHQIMNRYPDELP